MSDGPHGPRPMPGPNDELVAGVIYHYGLAMYLIQVVELQVVNLILASNLPRRNEITREEFLRLKQETLRKTMGRQLQDLIMLVDVPDGMRQRASKVVSERNDLAHRFFREHHDDMQSPSGNEQLIQELIDLQQVVVSLDEE